MTMQPTPRPDGLADGAADLLTRASIAAAIAAAHAEAVDRDGRFPEGLELDPHPGELLEPWLEALELCTGHLH